VAWEGSNRRAQLPPDWARRQAACIANAGGQCQQTLPSGARCPRDATDADHKGDPLDHDNLQALCPAHHKRKTSGEAQQGKARRGSWTREPEAHPGRKRT
jgi:5-methylcytosine-specific restriction protein A